MAGTRIGGLKTNITNKERYGVDFYKRVGHEGGKARVPKGFAISGKASEAGRIGGKISGFVRSKRHDPITMEAIAGLLKDGLV